METRTNGRRQGILTTQGGMWQGVVHEFAVVKGGFFRCADIEWNIEACI